MSWFRRLADAGIPSLITTGGLCLKLVECWCMAVLRLGWRCFMTSRNTLRRPGTERSADGQHSLRISGVDVLVS